MSGLSLLTSSSSDPLDDPHFSPTSYLNSLYPTSPSSSSFFTDLESHRSELSGLLYSTSTNLRSWSLAREQTKSKVQQCQAEIEGLVGIIAVIRKEGEKSEQMVEEICRDIRLLDLGKKNITKTVTVIKRLYMMASGVEQLGGMVAKSQFRAAAKLLLALEEMFGDFLETSGKKAKFEDSKITPVVMILHENVQKNKETLFLRIFSEFKAYMQDVKTSDQVPDLFELLSDACNVLTIMGEGSIFSLITWYVEEMFDTFKFDPRAVFENIESRFSWWKKTTLLYEKYWSPIFPSSWRVLCKLYSHFTKETAGHFSNIFRGKFDHNSFVRVYQLCIDWEESQEKFFHALNRFEQEDSEISNTELTSSLPIRVPSSLLSSAIVFNDITSSFAPFMNIYFNLEQENLAEMLDKLSKTELWWPLGITEETFYSNIANLFVKERDKNMDNSISVENFGIGNPARYPGSDTVFLWLKQSMRRAENMKLDHVTIMDLTSLYKRCLTQYAYMIWSKLPSTKRLISVISFDKSPFAINLINQTQSIDEKFSIKDDELTKLVDLTPAHIQAMCVAVNTSEYVLETLPLFQSSLLSLHAPHKQDVASVSLDGVMEHFEILLHKCLTGMTHVISSKYAKSFAGILKVDWNLLESVGDISQWVSEIDSLHRDFILPISISKTSEKDTLVLSETYSNYFFTQLVSFCCSKLVSLIFKTKNLGTFGIQQLLLDTNALKTIFTNLSHSGSGLVGYHRYVKAEFGRIQGILKTICSPLESVVSTYLAVMEKYNISEFTKILDFIQVNSNERKEMLEEFKLNCPSLTNVELIEEVRFESKYTTENVGYVADSLLQPASDVIKKLFSQS